MDGHLHACARRLALRVHDGAGAFAVCLRACVPACLRARVPACPRARVLTCLRACVRACARLHCAYTPTAASAGAQVCSVISKGDLTLREHQQDIDEVNRFVHKFEFPAGLRLRLRGYFRHCEGLRRAQKFRELVRKMSPGLQGEVSTVLFQRNFGQVRCFCAADKAERRHFGHMLALVLIPQVG